MRASRGEIIIEEILRENDIVFKQEVIFPELRTDNGRPLRFDFVIFDDDGNVDYIIEYQGRQHYEAVGKFGGKRGLYQQQYNDNKKRRFCALNGYRLIEIPYTDEDILNFDYIMERVGY